MGNKSDGVFFFLSSLLNIHCVSRHEGDRESSPNGNKAAICNYVLWECGNNSVSSFLLCQWIILCWYYDIVLEFYKSLLCNFIILHEYVFFFYMFEHFSSSWYITGHCNTGLNMSYEWDFAYKYKDALAALWGCAAMPCCYQLNADAKKKWKVWPADDAKSNCKRIATELLPLGDQGCTWKIPWKSIKYFFSRQVVDQIFMFGPKIPVFVSGFLKRWLKTFCPRRCTVAAVTNPNRPLMKVSLKLFKDEAQEKLRGVADMLQGIRLHILESNCVQQT